MGIMSRMVGYRAQTETPEQPFLTLTEKEWKAIKDYFIMQEVTCGHNTIGNCVENGLSNVWEQPVEEFDKLIVKLKKLEE